MPFNCHLYSLLVLAWHSLGDVLGSGILGIRLSWVWRVDGLWCLVSYNCAIKFGLLTSFSRCSIVGDGYILVIVVDRSGFHFFVLPKILYQPAD